MVQGVPCTITMQPHCGVTCRLRWCGSMTSTLSTARSSSSSATAVRAPPSPALLSSAPARPPAAPPWPSWRSPPSLLSSWLSEPPSELPPSLPLPEK